MDFYYKFVHFLNGPSLLKLTKLHDHWPGGGLRYWCEFYHFSVQPNITWLTNKPQNNRCPSYLKSQYESNFWYLYFSFQAYYHIFDSLCSQICQNARIIVGLPRLVTPNPLLSLNLNNSMSWVRIHKGQLTESWKNTIVYNLPK